MDRQLASARQQDHNTNTQAMLLNPARCERLNLNSHRR